MALEAKFTPHEREVFIKAHGKKPEEVPNLDVSRERYLIQDYLKTGDTGRHSSWERIGLTSRDKPTDTQVPVDTVIPPKLGGPEPAPTPAPVAPPAPPTPAPKPAPPAPPLTPPPAVTTPASTLASTPASTLAAAAQPPPVSAATALPGLAMAAPPGGGGNSLPVPGGPFGGGGVDPSMLGLQLATPSALRQGIGQRHPPSLISALAGLTRIY